MRCADHTDRTSDPVPEPGPPLAAVPGRRARRGRRLPRPRAGAAPARSGRSCWRSPTPRAGTRRTGSPCSATTSASRCAATCAPGCSALLARRFGSVFVLALAQRAEARSPYDDDADATPHHGRRRAHPRRGGARPGGARPEPALRHVPGGGVRRQRRPGQQPRAGRSASARSGVDNRDRAADRAGRAAGRRAVDGRGRVRLGAVAARTARGARRRTPRRDAAAAAPRRRRQRAGPASTARGGWTGRRGRTPTRPTRCSAVACARPSTVPPPRSRRRARGVGTGLGRGACRASASSPRARSCRCCRTCSAPRADRGRVAAALVGLALLATGATVGLLSGASPLRARAAPARDRLRRRRVPPTCSAWCSAPRCDVRHRTGTGKPHQGRGEPSAGDPPPSATPPCG